MRLSHLNYLIVKPSFRLRQIARPATLNSYGISGWLLWRKYSNMPNINQMVGYRLALTSAHHRKRIPSNMMNKKRIPIAEKDIVELHRRPEGTVSEDDLKSVLRRYNLRDALTTIGRASFYIFTTHDPNNIYKIAHRDPETGVILSQWALAYLANIFLISGSNDYKAKYLSANPDNLIVLCNLYGNNLQQLETVGDTDIGDSDNFRSFMVRIDFEQLEYQFTPVYMIARTIVLFNDVARRLEPQRFDLLPEIFERNTGLNTSDYLLIAMAVASGAQKTATFRPTMFTGADISKLKGVLSAGKVQNFLQILSTDYRRFREEDEKANSKLDRSLTKTRFNPLWIFPIIESHNRRTDPFIVPNSLTYVKAAFGGLYWWFHRCFEVQGIQQEFRNYFGYLFQDYVGLVLKGIYGEKNVHPELAYGRDKIFIDWWLERQGKVYLFEVKANQFALGSRQTGEKGLIVKSEIRKVAEAIEQVYRRVQDVAKYEELKVFKDKRLLPFIVFFDMPFISGPMYEDWIRESLAGIEAVKGLTGLRDFPCFLLNIEELELFDGAVNKIEMEEIFPVLRQNPGKGFLSVVREITGEQQLRNHFLDDVYQNFFGPKLTIEQ